MQDFGGGEQTSASDEPRHRPRGRLEGHGDDEGRHDHQTGPSGLGVAQQQCATPGAAGQGPDPQPAPEQQLEVAHEPVDQRLQGGEGPRPQGVGATRLCVLQGEQAVQRQGQEPQEGLGGAARGDLEEGEGAGLPQAGGHEGRHCELAAADGLAPPGEVVAGTGEARRQRPEAQGVAQQDHRHPDRLVAGEAEEPLEGRRQRGVDEVVAGVGEDVLAQGMEEQVREARVVQVDDAVLDPPVEPERAVQIDPIAHHMPTAHQGRPHPHHGHRHIEAQLEPAGDGGILWAEVHASQPIRTPPVRPARGSCISR